MGFQHASANFLPRWALGQRTATLIYVVNVLEKTHIAVNKATTETESDSGRIGNKDEEWDEVREEQENTAGIVENGSTINSWCPIIHVIIMFRAFQASSPGDHMIFISPFILQV